MKSNFRGFTLVEMSIVIVILGLMAALILPGIFKTIERNRLERGRAEIVALKNEIVGFVVSQSGSDRILPDDLDIFSGQFDQWDQEFLYIRGINDGDNICSLSTTDIVVQKTGVPPITTQNIAFVLVGSGKNMRVQAQCGGAVCDTSHNGYFSGTIEIFDQGTTNSVFPGFEYDDIVEYVGLFEIIGKACP